MLVHIIFYVKNKEKLFLNVQKSFRRGLGNGNYWNMIFPGFPVFPVQEIDHFSCFPAGNSNTRKCATLFPTHETLPFLFATSKAFRKCFPFIGCLTSKVPMTQNKANKIPKHHFVDPSKLGKYVSKSCINKYCKKTDTLSIKSPRSIILKKNVCNKQNQRKWCKAWHLW